jgi:sugar phosphate permease
VSRINYGWIVVALAMLIYMLVIGSTFGAFGLFVHPVSAELGLSRAEMNTALILMNLGNAAVAPLLGRVLDRFPVRRVFLACAALLGLGLVALGLSQSVWLSAAVLAVVLPLGYLGAGTMTMSVLIARWFAAQRGRAMAIASIGMSLGNVTVAPLVGLLIQGGGWRTALLTAGIGIGAVLVGVAFLLRERPGLDDVEQRRAPAPSAEAIAKAAAGDQPASVGAILRSQQFWSIGLSTAIALGVIQTIAITLVPLGQESGLTMIRAASLMSFMGGGAIAGALLLAFIADKIDRVILLTVLLLLGAVLNALLPYADTYGRLAAAAGLLGVTSGAFPPLFFALLADRFGPASFGTCRGLTMPLIAALGMIAVRFAGEVYDRTGGYDLLFNTFIIAQLVAAALMLATRFVRPMKLGGTVAPTLS